jgi:hypothetical protein
MDRIDENDHYSVGELEEAIKLNASDDSPKKDEEEVVDIDETLKEEDSDIDEDESEEDDDSDIDEDDVEENLEDKE